MDIPSIVELFPEFDQEFRRKVEAAIKSGALPDGTMDEYPYFVYRSCLILTAEGFKPLGKEAKAILANLRRFI